MPRKERTNAKTWERDRRNRMNTYFKTLSDLLPSHQEGRKRNKVDILIYAAKYIKDLTNRTEELFYAHAVDAHKEELNRLKKLVAQLYSRTQLLSTLLKEAGITVPPEPALEKISPLKWSNKINVDDVDKYLDRYNECKKPVKRKSKPTGVRVPSKKKLPATSPKKSPADKDSSESVDTPSEDQENHVSTSIIDAEGLSTPETPPKSPEPRNSPAQATTTDSTSCGSAGPKSGPGIRKLESRKKMKRKKPAPEDEKQRKSPDLAHQGNQPLGNIIPGTLILSGGKIMPLMTPITLPSNILVNAQAQSSNQIILGNNQANPMIVMQSIGSRIQHSVVPVRNQNIVKAVQKVTLNTVPSIRTNVGINSQDWVSNVRTIVEATKIGGRKGILPKGKEITKTTMTYKVPIPAIHREGIVSKNSDNNVSEKIEPKSRIKKPGKSKKIKEKEKNSMSKDDKILDSDSSKNEEKGRKRKNAGDAECSPPKVIKSSLPETCVSIENLRHVVEKIGEDECSDKPQKLNPEKPESAQNSVKTPSSSCGVAKEQISPPEKSAELTETSKPEESLKKSNPETSHEPPPTVNPTIPKSCESSVSHSSNQSSPPEDSSFPQLEPPKPVSNPPLSEVDKAMTETEDKIRETKDDCDLGRLNNLLNAATSQPQVPEDSRAIMESGKIILNLDTNTTTTMKQGTSVPGDPIPPAPSSAVPEGLPKDEKSKEMASKSLSYPSGSTFVPINSRNESLHSDLSNDLFASLQVPSSSHNPESISPTAAFLMAFPLVSSLNGKTEVLEEDMKEDLKYHSQTPPMLLQIGTIEPTIFKPKSNENKCQETTREKEKTPECPDKPLDIAPKSLPKIINNEPIKERLYKVVPYSEPAMPTFPSASTITSNPSNPVPHSDPQPKKIVQNSLENPPNNLLVIPKPEDQMRKVQKVETSSIPSSRPMDQTPKYDSNMRYPSHPEFLPNYSNFTSTDNQMSSTPRVSYPSHSPSQVPQPVYSYQIPRQTFVNRPKNVSSMDNQIVTYTMSQTRPTTAPDPNDYQTRNVNPVMPVSSQSLQYNYPPRPKDSYPHQHQEHRVYVEQGQAKDSSICQSSYSMHKEPQMYHDYSIVGKTSSLDSFQLSRSYVPPSSSIKDPPQNYQSYLPIVQTKEQTREVPANLPQNYPDQSKQPSLETFDNLQRDFDSTRKDPFVPSTSAGSKLPKTPQNNQNSEAQRIETSISSAVNKHPQDHFNTNYSKGNGSLVSDPQYQVKRSEPQTYGLYPRDQKKMFENPSNTQVKPHVQPSLPRYPHQFHQQQQQQTNVTTCNYGQSITENPGKSTTTVAHNSSTYSILSWTTLSPMGLGSNNNLVHFEAGADHVDDNEGKTICENFNYSQLHKETVGFGNILQGEQYSAPEAILDKSKPKMSSDNKQGYEDSSKSKNVQSIQQKQTSRSHNQNQNQNQSQNIGDDFKYSGENKNKSKYSMDSAYTQTEFGGLDQRHQHTIKPHQIPESKAEKTAYSIPYDSQITFDLADPVGQSQTKCPDIYTGSNYKYGDDKDQHSQIKYQPILQGQAPVVLNDNVSYNSSKGNQQQQQQQNMNKSKGVQQQVQPVRPPVNWMMTPEVKHNSNIADLILPPIGKELDFCQNNIFGQTPSYNQGTSNQFYNNYDVSVSAAHSFSNVGALQSDRFYPEEQPFSWSPTKNPQSGADHQGMKTLDQQVVPSTLPTLVGDLALGTNIPEKQSFLFGQVPPRSNELPKTSGKEKDSNFQVMLNPQTGQHTNQGTSFLSVSQLVEHEKAEKSHHQQNHHSHHHHSQVQPQPRKQRKSNTSPRTTAKRQMDMRKQSNDQQMQQHDDQKIPSTHGFSDQYQQQPQQQQAQQSQKYLQNDGLWRNRNCKSNYTAEALIGVNNTSLHDGSASDKQLHAPAIKFSTDYSQNKFPGSLGTTEMVMPPINYLTNPEDGNGYGQVMNQNFNHSSYTYSPNTNIYPSTNFIAGISNTTSSYMMPLHENPTDYLETNSFLLPNVNNVTTSKSGINTSSSVSSVSTTRASASVTAPTNVKNQHYNNTGKQQQCDKRNSYTNVSKKSKRKSDTTMQNLEFPIGGVAATMEDYHSHHHTHPSTFLPPPPHANPLYQNQSISNANRSRGGSGSGNSVAMAHHPSGTSLTNFNLSTIFPEINDKVTGYKPPNTIQPGLSQSSNHPSTSYPQRPNYTTNNSLGHVAQVSQSEAAQFTTDLPVPPPPSVLHYKAT
ncbi:uncharacterized protein LOC107042467 [Diachasma alloeum]|uniref:uncharacterized protein LOC107042467 n=1 Tax=Diachasma alloeum TaxID=454923 RepID=UPI00073818B5|nr:uncharacterized protein LOC107042467 [Diachasma alloeum]